METHYVQNFSKTNFLSETESSIQLIAINIQSSVKRYKAHGNELRDFLVSNYIREIWIGETPPPIYLDTYEIVDFFIEGKEKPSELDSQHWIKIKNLNKSFDYLFSLDSNGYDFFSVELVIYIHQIIGNGLIPDCGNYRTKRVMASGSSVMYATPSSIEVRLADLFIFIHTAIKNAPQDAIQQIIYMIRLGSFFFSEFLMIHPFSDGNGRTARVLLNAFLRHTVVIPMSFFSHNREEYMDALEKRIDHSPPSALARYILLACNQTASQVNWLMMYAPVEDNDPNTQEVQTIGNSLADLNLKELI